MPMLPDAIATIGRSRVQMGPFNDRIYLMSLAPEDFGDVSFVDALLNVAAHDDLSKIFAKVPKSCVRPFFSRGFEQEAQVPGMFTKDDGAFLSLYRHPWRKVLDDKEALDHVLSVAAAKKGKGNPSSLPVHLHLRRLGAADVHALASLYGSTFATYPFPITNPAFLTQGMEDGVRFMGVFKEDALVGAASAEIGADGHSAEMTDFAVNPDFRKQGIAGALLCALERSCAESGINCLFTIARACSYGINALFAKGDYAYSGQLRNNTNIGGHLESMNVWHKFLS